MVPKNVPEACRSGRVFGVIGEGGVLFEAGTVGLV